MHDYYANDTRHRVWSHNGAVIMQFILVMTLALTLTLALALTLTLRLSCGVT